MNAVFVHRQTNYFQLGKMRDKTSRFFSKTKDHLLRGTYPLGSLRSGKSLGVKLLDQRHIHRRWAESYGQEIINIASVRAASRYVHQSNSEGPASAGPFLLEIDSQL